MTLPFHKQTLDEWHQALGSPEESKLLIKELADNCGIYTLEGHTVWRARLNLNAAEITANLFDSPPIEMQNKIFNRFQPLKTNCLYTTASEETAILEALPGLADMDDIIYVAEMRVAKPLKLLNLVNNIFFKGGSNEPLWNYKPLLGPMFLVEDPLGVTKVLEVTQILSQKIFESNFDGILYASRSDHLANLKRNSLSLQFNYLLFGSPIRESKLTFQPETVRTYRIKPNSLE